jgi:hypothetical protein
MALVAKPGSISGDDGVAEAEALRALSTSAKPNPLRIHFPKRNFIVNNLQVN